jgi:heme/copper-type cytochrome/quinol oxidase subunit 2
MANIKQGVTMIVGVVIGVVVFAAMFPMVYETVDDANATGATATLLDNLPLFLVLGIVLAIIVGALAYISKGSGGD